MRGWWPIVLCLTVSCAEQPAEDGLVCPRSAAAFNLTLTAAGGTLPEDMTLSVTYGGATTERFELGEGAVAHEALCCVPGDGAGVSLSPADCGKPFGQDASLAAQEPRAEELRCSIWSGGAANIVINAAGYQSVEETLVASQDDEHPECDALSTVDVHLVLAYPEAGVLQR